jgi:hypothetical protein
VTAVAGPVIGEFGYAVFMTAPRINSWFTRFPDHERIIACPMDWELLFPKATSVQWIPRELIPQPGCGTGWFVARGRVRRRPQQLRYPADLAAWFYKLANKDAKWFSPPLITNVGRPPPPYHSEYKWLDKNVKHVDPLYLKYRGEPLVNERTVVVAARRRLEFGPVKSWPPRYWDELCGSLQEQFPDIKLLSIGTPKGSYFPKFTEHYHGLKNAIRALSNADCSISSNSGLTHLSLMCDCPTFSWGEKRPDLPYIMRVQANPHETPGEYRQIGWRPSLKWALKYAATFIENNRSARHIETTTRD